MNKRAIIVTIALGLLLVTAGCSDTQGDDYQDAPEEIQDGSLDYQDYKEADCPYLEGSLDQETMEKCNEWIRNNSTETNR
jgi:hypothetical protein